MQVSIFDVHRSREVSQVKGQGVMTDLVDVNIQSLDIQDEASALIPFSNSEHIQIWNVKERKQGGA